MFLLVLTTLLGAAPTQSAQPECEPSRELVLDVARWQSDLRNPAKRCDAISAARFSADAVYRCTHPSEFLENESVAHGARYSLPAQSGRNVALLCTGPASGRCTELVALRPLSGKNRWCRLSIFAPRADELERERYYVMNADRSGTIRSINLVPVFDCKVMTEDGTATDSCAGDKITFHWKVTPDGLVVREPSLQLNPEEMAAQREQERGEAKEGAAAETAPMQVTFARIRSVGTVPPTSVWSSTRPGMELTSLWWMGEQLCVTQDPKETTVRCYDPVDQHWSQPKPIDASMKRGTIVRSENASVRGQVLKLRSKNSDRTWTKCHGFEELQATKDLIPIATLDGSQTMQLGGYPDREIVRLDYSPSGRYGVAVVPNFERLSNRTEPSPPGTLNCGDANFTDWAVISYQLYVFATAP